MQQSRQRYARLEDFAELHAKMSDAIKGAAPWLPALLGNAPYTLSFEMGKVLGTKSLALPSDAVTGDAEG